MVFVLFMNIIKYLTTDAIQGNLSLRDLFGQCNLNLQRGGGVVFGGVEGLT